MPHAPSLSLFSFTLALLPLKKRLPAKRIDSTLLAVKTKFVLIKNSHAHPPPHQYDGQTLSSSAFEVTEEIWIIV